MKDNIKGLWKILFGRTTIFAVLIVAQAILLLGGFAFLGAKVIIANNVIGLLSVVILIYIINVRYNTSFKLMWIIIIVATPLIGVPLFIYTRLQPGTRHIAGRVDAIIREQGPYLLPEKATQKKLISEAEREYGIFKYLFKEAHYPAYQDSGVLYFAEGQDKFERLIEELKGAKEFIFLEYFIVSKGHVWNAILEILKEKAAQGVEVRFLYDGTNTLVNLPPSYPRKMKEAGIQCKVFSPMIPFLSTHQNNRDHRKIVVIDGHTAFTGGVNLADEYANIKERFGYWKDTAVMVKGKAVDSFTLMFMQMWNINSQEREDYEKYLRRSFSSEESIKYGGYILPFGDSPFDHEEVGKRVYLDIINRADSYVHITTPYLILDEEMTNALIFAAQRGIDVKIILPHIPDKKYAYFIARTHYEELIEKGVKIYEFTPGFIHAKSFVSDDEKAVVGTINLDFRSLFLHFECGVYMWKSPVVEDVERDFQETLDKCNCITLRDCHEYSPIGKICGRALRLVAPLM